MGSEMCIRDSTSERLPKRDSYYGLIEPLAGGPHLDLIRYPRCEVTERAELVDLLRRVNVARARGEAEEPVFVEAVPSLRVEIARARRRLAIYGTLAPGQPNYDVVAPYGGTWAKGTVEGTLYPAGWGAAFGAPALVWQPGEGRVPVHLLESERLESAWRTLDDFEGTEYLRILVPVNVRDEIQVANLYALRAEIPSDHRFGSSGKQN